MKWIGLHSLLPLLVFAALVSGCTAKMSDKVDKVAQREAAEVKEACDRGECPCDTPVGNIAHGGKVLAYTVGVVACNQSCSDVSVELTCNNGKFDREIEGLNFRCEAESCPVCTLGENRINAGETVMLYRQASVGCRESCEDFKLARVCEAGKLTGSDDFHFVACQRRTCRCPLPDASASVSLDGSVDLYSVERAECGKKCEVDYKQVRTCVTTDAEQTFHLNGGSQYRYRSCEEATNCFCTLPNSLGVLSHGQTRDISKIQTVSCGQTCSSTPTVTVKCENGVLKNNANLSEVINFSTAQYADYKYRCQEETCATCPVPGTSLSVPHGATYHFAKSPSVGCSETCEFLDRTCNNGTFLGDTSFNAANCAKRDCKCQVGGAGGNEVTVGSNWTFYSANKAECGQNCVDISSPRLCTEVQNGATYTYEFGGNTTYSFPRCDEATGCSCALPGGLGDILDGKVVILTSEATVSCGKSCDEVASIDVKCSNGVLIRPGDGSVVNSTAADFAYKYYCIQTGCASCTLPGYGTIENGRSMTLYAKDQMGCADRPELLTYEFKCENSILLRNGNLYVPANDPEAPATWYTSYTFNCPGCPLPWGGSVGEGTTITAYKFFGTVVNNCGRGCKAAQRKCESGVLLGDPSYNMQACDNSCNMEGGGAPPRACLLPWQNSYITPDSQVPVWSKKRVACGDSCQNYFKLSSCDMETGTFKLPFDYIYQSCTEVCP